MILHGKSVDSVVLCDTAIFNTTVVLEHLITGVSCVAP
jgi:hypothetical protein